MKLTKLQRYTAYIILLEEAKQEVKSNGLCNTIRSTFWLSNSGEVYCDYRSGDYEPHHRVVDLYFPELFAKQTGSYIKGFSEFYFKDWAERIAALKECIKETEPK